MRQPVLERRETVAVTFLIWADGTQQRFGPYTTLAEILEFFGPHRHKFTIHVERRG